MKVETEAGSAEIFVLRGDDERYYLYAPLDHAVAVVNSATVAAVGLFLKEGEDALTAAQLAVVEKLRGSGVLPNKPAERPVPPPDYLFRPCEVTLFPTTLCNLRCVYCYADAGNGDRTLCWEPAKSAIDLVAQNASLMGRNNFVVGFHGGGEPMLNWELVARSVEYAHEIASKYGLKAHVHAASNGILGPAQREFVTKHFSGINLSIDGPREIHDGQRPRADGSGSFEQVMETVRYLEKAKFPYGVRATVTERSVLQMKEMVHFFRDACPSLEQLHVEPVWYCGRCKTSGTKTPDQAVFVRHFLEAWDEGNRIGLSLFYSGARLDAITNKFCAAPGDGFSVTPEGIATSCFEVTDADDPRASLFHYGRYDPEAGDYVFDTERIARLRELTVDKIPHCDHCFCKWHCAGDCLAKALSGADPQLHQGSARCELNRAITFAEIRRIVENVADEHAESC